MAEERAIAAMRRIEGALLRIEAAAARPSAHPAPAPDTALAERHAALREGVAALLAKLGQGDGGGEGGLMAQVELRIGGRSYEMACRDGEEARFEALAAVVDEKVETAGRALGNANEGRRLIAAALLLADELAEARFRAAAPPPADPWDGIADLMEEIADRLEAVAARLDGGLEPEPEAP